MIIMKLCEVCIKSDILCNACNQKIESGELTDLDIKITRAINITGTKADFSDVYENEEFVIIIADSENYNKLIGKSGSNAKKISESLEKKIRIIEKSDEKTMAESLLNTPIIGINILYSGKERYILRINKMYRKNVKRDMIGIIENIIGKKLEIIFE